MKEDKQAEKLARLEQMRRCAQERMEAQQARIEKRFERARRRIMADQSRPSDDQQRIVTAALELLNETGLQELSLRKLAARVDLKAPALYWYFKNKEELIDYMAAAILYEEFADLESRHDDEQWQAWLLAIGKRLRKAMLAYRDGGRVVAGAHLYPATTLSRLIETGLQSLASAGLELRQARLMMMAVVSFVFGSVIEEQSAPSAEEVKHLDIQEFFADYPLMAESLKGWSPDNANQEFEDALRIIIGGNGK